LSRRAEFEEFVALQGPGLLRFALWLTADPHDAEDLLQMALTRTYARWAKVGDDPIRYVRQVLVNGRRDWWRRRARAITKAVPTVELHLPAIDGAVSERESLRRALLTLTGKERVVVVLKHYYDLSEQQVAAELGIAIGTVKSTNARSLRKLRAALVEDPWEARET